ncbi:MAG: sigma 54-interacting transcriptional regulator [Alphaproteobacteria bacterium]|nr:sigma 54-interacting transcriptional regulator [Alphaproteobacteria bacterium]
MSETVVVGFYGSVVDGGRTDRRWERWRPTVSLFQAEDLAVDRLVLLVHPRFAAAASVLLDDIRRLAPTTVLEPVPFPLEDPWDFEEVYGALLDFAQSRVWPDGTDLLVHITPGSHVAQICLFLLTEARFLPGRLLQTSPPRAGSATPPWSVIDLDLARYDRIAQRLERVAEDGSAFLKQGIETRNAAFNLLMDRIERVAVRSREPLLLTGPTGAGKTRLARRIYALRHRRGLLPGPMVEMNCATLRGDGAMAALFGHVRGAFTGAVADREGLLRRADRGLLFLDEIAELGLDEQAMLLRAIEEHTFLPVGSDREVESHFQLIAGTCADLHERVADGRFREDLLARIDLWHFDLPGLADRPEDVEPNLDWELQTFADASQRSVRMSADARARFLAFATGPDAAWRGNFRDLHAAVVRMGTLASGGRVRGPDVDEEIVRLRRSWGQREPGGRVEALLGDRAAELDRFDRVQLEDVLAVCASSASLSAAGRVLFARSRERRASTNDADRLRKYLDRFGLTFAEAHAAG